METEVVADYANEIGENPLWHPGEEALYWCAHDGSAAGELFRYDPAADAHERVHETSYIGGFTVQADGSLLLFEDGGRVTVWRDGSAEPVFEALGTEAFSGEDEDVLFNDVVADPEGRVFCGTRYEDDRTGGLYRLDRDRTLTRVVDGVGISNGLGFSPDLGTLYYTDSGPSDRRILAYDYDRATGALADERVFARVETGSGEGLPDGLTVDAEGTVLSARAFGGCVVAYAPDGTETARIDLPVDIVTSVAFGGGGSDDLYVTTGGGEQKAERGAHSGALLRTEWTAPGREPFRSRVGTGM